MAKFVYVGLSSASKKAKAIYLGMSSKARKVTKAYIGVSNIARQFYPATPKYSETRGPETFISSRSTTSHSYEYPAYGSYTFDPNTGIYRVNSPIELRLYADPQTSISYAINGYDVKGSTCYQLTICKAFSYNPGTGTLQVIYSIYGLPMTAKQNY